MLAKGLLTKTAQPGFELMTIRLMAMSSSNWATLTFSLTIVSDLTLYLQINRSLRLSIDETFQYISVGVNSDGLKLIWICCICRGCVCQIYVKSIQPPMINTRDCVFYFPKFVSTIYDSIEITNTVMLWQLQNVGLIDCLDIALN